MRHNLLHMGTAGFQAENSHIHAGDVRILQQTSAEAITRYISRVVNIRFVLLRCFNISSRLWPRARKPQATFLLAQPCRGGKIKSPPEFSRPRGHFPCLRLSHHAVISCKTRPD